MAELKASVRGAGARIVYDFDKALIVADWDIKTNWQKYVRNFYRVGS